MSNSPFRRKIINVLLEKNVKPSVAGVIVDLCQTELPDNKFCDDPFKNGIILNFKDELNFIKIEIKADENSFKYVYFSMNLELLESLLMTTAPENVIKYQYIADIFKKIKDKMLCQEFITTGYTSLICDAIVNLVDKNEISKNFIKTHSEVLDRLCIQPTVKKFAQQNQSNIINNNNRKLIKNLETQEIFE